MQSLEPAAKVLAATSVSQSLSFCLERKYLQDIAEKPVFELDPVYSVVENDASWIAIDQIGKPIEKSAENCFSAIQKILYSCFLPKEIELLFLIIGDGREVRMYLGLRSPGKALPPKGLVRNLNEFLKGVWPGLHTSIVQNDDKFLSDYKKAMSDETLENIYAFTGIPSMESQYKTLYPATIDNLIAGMNKSKKFAYLVVADPIETSDTEFMLYQCREMGGQAESLKTMSVTEGLSFGTNSSVSKSHTSSHTDSVSESISKKDFTKLGKLAMTATGLGMAASVFPTAGAVLNGCMDAAGAITTAAASMLGCSMVGNFVNSIMPQKTNSVSSSDTESDTDTHTIGSSESKSSSISRNLVNRHIEAVSEHLFYHSKRLETGKATGLWRVGVYLMADKMSELQGGALQLRSILSGQESIFEPIRIHNISSIMDEVIDKKHSLRELTLGQFSSPILAVNDGRGRRFEHPLGDQYKELKTVLTTKELSYLVNFPLRSVPGINVVDSSPEFSLNKPTIDDPQNSVSIGKLLYGGSLTDIDYSISLDRLSKHAFVCGIDGAGKTNTVKNILNGVSDKIPFLVIEPVKTEYVEWAVAYNREHPETQISIFIPGCNSYKDKQSKENIGIKQLKLNPFDLIWLSGEQNPNVLSHIDRIKPILTAAFPKYDILPILIEDIIYALYQNESTDWLNQTPVFGKTKVPTLEEMRQIIDTVVQNRGFVDDISVRNVKTCLKTRIDSLLRGWKGETFNSSSSTPFSDLYTKPCVINLSYVSDESDKCFIMALLLLFLYEYRLASAEIGQVDDKDCCHLTVVEEANRIMKKCDNQESAQYKIASLFSNMLLEIKAYNEGVLFVDKDPSSLTPDILKSTNLKIIHRLVSEDDCRLVAESVGIKKEQYPIIPKLSVGQCLISSSLSRDNHWIIVNEIK